MSFFPGLAVTSLTDISTLGGPAATDVLSLNRAGIDYKTTAAAARGFIGIQRIDLKAKYGARCDGTSHPLSGTYGSLAAAQAVYPNAGLTSGNWSAMEMDTAAWLQAEYDLRTGSSGAGIIGLNDGATMMVSQQLNMQDASRVWFHGGRRVTLIAAAAVAAGITSLRIANTPNVGVVLCDLQVQAQAAGVGPGNTGGAAWTGYTSGASFLQVDNAQGVIIERVGWNGFDHPIKWGDNVYGIHFKHSGGGGNNIGLNWDQTTSLNSLELLIFEHGSLSNNNYGFNINATYGPDGSGKNQYAQGGSIFIKDTSIDYNNVRGGVFVGTPPSTANGVNTYSGSCLHLAYNHIETTCACSGTTARILSDGDLSVISNTFYENNNDGTKPVGLIEVSPGTAATALSNTLTMDSSVPIFYSAVAGNRRLVANGNRMHDANARPIMISDPSGITPQSAASDGTSTLPLLYNDIAGALMGYYGQVIQLFYFAGPDFFTLPGRAKFPVRPGYVQPIINAGPTTATIRVESDGSVSCLQSGPAPGPLKMAPGAIVYATLIDTNNQWLVSGQLTA